jgi:hypothetical protein
MGNVKSEHCRVCDVCKRGILVRTPQEIAFQQWTGKGTVFCRVTVPIAICAKCGFTPIQIAAGVIAQRQTLDDAGQPVTVSVAKYGLHALRHACASLWIEQGYNPKQIQPLMGHSSIKVTSTPTVTYSSTAKWTSTQPKA